VLGKLKKRDSAEGGRGFLFFAFTLLKKGG